ncbi:MAG: DUF427 domain-containing protein [Gammaproteobacteria bacterium]|nr:DUF427 domain-containing protein [Gammaproteobacteria bacterium]
MPKASWKGTVLAETEEYEVVEGNIYFPVDSINSEFFKASATQSHCPWKGDASYYDIQVGAEVNPDAAWYYPETKDAAKNIQGYIAFWKGVEVIE